MSSTRILVCSAQGVRILRSSLKRRWVIELVLDSRSYEVGAAGVVLILLAMRKQTISELVSDASERFGVNPDSVLGLANRLLDEGVLIPVQDIQKLSELPTSLEQRLAWYYHYATTAMFDVPSIDSDDHDQRDDDDQHDTSNPGRGMDPEWADFVRCKRIRGSATDLTSDWSLVGGLDLGPVCGRFNSAQQEVPLLQLLWLLTTKVGEHKAFADAEPLLLRTSPSAGSHHPTEVYVAYMQGQQFTAPSLYHCQMDPAGLVSLPIPEDCSAGLWADFGDSSHPNEHDEVFYLLFAPVFERTMCKYFTSRSYRLIFMDVGHLIMTAARIFENCGYRTSVSLALDHDQIQKSLGFERLEESGVAVMRLHKPAS